MNKVFVDTNALIAIKNKSDSLYTQALEIQSRLVKEQWHFVTTSAVLLELFYKILRRPQTLDKQLSEGHHGAASPSIAASRHSTSASS